MRLPENPSVLAQIKVFTQKLPLGTSLTLHDLMRYFPNHTENTLSASLSTLTAAGCMEVEEDKVWSVFKDRSGREFAGNLKSYVLVNYPDLHDLRQKPEFSSKPKTVKEEPAPKAPLIKAKDVPLKEGEKFDRVFALNPSIKFDPSALAKLGKEVIYCTDFAVHDSVIGEKARSRYDRVIAQRMKDFNPVRDVVAIYGDSMVLAMVVFYLASKQVKRFNVSRYMVRDDDYFTREISIDNFA